MPAFDAIIKNEGKLGILAPDSLGGNSSSRRGYIAFQVETELALLPILTER